MIAGRAATNPAEFALPDDTVTDGEGKELSLMIGVNSGDGRGNITAYATVYDGDEILQGDRDYSACSLNPATGASFACGGSSTNAGGRFTDFSTYDLTTDTATDLRPYNGATDQYNFGPLNHYQRPERRYSLGAMGHYEFNEHADVYTQLMFNDYESIAQIAPSGNFFETNSINCDNPLLPASILATIGCDAGAIASGDSVTMYIGRRNVEGGGRQQSFANNSFRAVAGVRGAINDAWGYDVSAQYSSVSVNTSTLNYYVTPRVARALDVTSTSAACRPASRCIDGTDANCVPWNPFVPGGITQDQLGYLQAAGLQIGRISQEIYNGIITGDLGVYGIKSPMASDGIQLVFGAEYRRDDAEQQRGRAPGSRPARRLRRTDHPHQRLHARSRSCSSKRGSRSPRIRPGPRASRSTPRTVTRTTAAARRPTPTSSASSGRPSRTSGSAAASSVRSVRPTSSSCSRLRVSTCSTRRATPAARRRVTRTPATRSASRRACRRASSGAGSLDSPAGQYNFLQGGNTELTPEESDTVSYGVVFTPRFAPGLAITVDYFDIEITDTISTFGANNILTACYSGGDAQACSAIQRNPGTGQLWIGTGNVVDLNTNIGSLSTKGWDFNVGYTGLEMGRFGSLAMNLTGTYLEELITQPVPGLDIDPTDRVRDYYDCTGFYSTVCGTPSPTWRHRFRTTWQTPWDVDLSATWRYYHSVKGLDGANDQMSENNLDYELPAENYFDLAANWAITEKAAGVARYQQRAGRQPVAQRRGRYHGQRQHVPADLRRPRSLRLRAGDAGLLRRPLRRIV